ncbi:hypothetical protein OUZ56_001441 [Daphnia magna]|uniref:Uncharacterized protein n=1 Tax=Daphnia magna TaxID=35525 RepID=A0ABR0A373_9CRUS|nr:hypothetical protein OUZ56_001441 [Daphnia magna]
MWEQGKRKIGYRQHNDINTSYHIYRAKQGGVALPFDEVDDADPRLFASQRAKGISLLSKKEGHVYSMFQLYWITSTTGSIHTHLVFGGLIYLGSLSPGEVEGMIP